MYQLLLLWGYSGKQLHGHTCTRAGPRQCHPSQVTPAASSVLRHAEQSCSSSSCCCASSEWAAHVSAPVEAQVHAVAQIFCQDMLACCLQHALAIYSRPVHQMPAQQHGTASATTSKVVEAGHRASI